jgi:16S rRNA (uracil1498-N3)-methyltransferase
VGVSSFKLYPASRSEKKALSEQNLKRLQTIILSSVKQCGRLYLPKIELKESLKACLEGQVLFGDLESSNPQIPIEKNITLVIGPEGGFTPQERSLLVDYGAKGILLSRNTLRAETAAVVGAALVASNFT